MNKNAITIQVIASGPPGSGKSLAKFDMLVGLTDQGHFYQIRSETTKLRCGAEYTKITAILRSREPIEHEE